MHLNVPSFCGIVEFISRVDSHQNEADTQQNQLNHADRPMSVPTHSSMGSQIIELQHLCSIELNGKPYSKVQNKLYCRIGTAVPALHDGDTLQMEERWMWYGVSLGAVTDCYIATAHRQRHQLLFSQTNDIVLHDCIVE